MRLSQIILSVALAGAYLAANAASVSFVENQTEAQQMKESAVKEATKSLLKVDDPYYDPKDHNRAIIRVDSKIPNNGGRTPSHCLVLLSKLLVQGTTDKGTWVPEKTECK